MADLDYREFMELEADDFDPGPRSSGEFTGDDYDFEDVDCADCGLKFYIRPSLYATEHWICGHCGHPKNNELGMCGFCHKFPTSNRLSVFGKKPWPKKCPRCEQGLPPLYEY